MAPQGGATSPADAGGGAMTPRGRRQTRQAMGGFEIGS
jgi:hypothetical protein